MDQLGLRTKEDGGKGKCKWQYLEKKARMKSGTGLW